MPTLREVRDAAARKRDEEQSNTESHEEIQARHRQIAWDNGIRNLTAEEYRTASRMAGDHHPRAVIGWPLDAPAMFNANNEPCDMWNGPCCCGAVHEEGI